MPKVIFNEAITDVFFRMTEKQEKEKKEQFGTGYGRIVNGQFVLDCFEEWPEYLFDSRSEGSIVIKDKAWDWVFFNMEMKQADFIFTLHTHPEWYGSNRPLDANDTETFKQWSEYFRKDYKRDDIININGIMALNGGLHLHGYDNTSDRFFEVGYEVDYNNQYVDEPVLGRGGR